MKGLFDLYCLHRYETLSVRILRPIATSPRSARVTVKLRERFRKDTIHLTKTWVELQLRYFSTDISSLREDPRNNLGPFGFNKPPGGPVLRVVPAGGLYRCVHELPSRVCRLDLLLGGCCEEQTDCSSPKMDLYLHRVPSQSQSHENHRFLDRRNLSTLSITPLTFGPGAHCLGSSGVVDASGKSSLPGKTSSLKAHVQRALE